MTKVIGIENYVSKSTGKLNTILHTMQEFDSWKLAKGAKGMKADTVFIPFDCTQDVEVGSTIKLIYGKGYGGKAVVTDLEVI